MDQSVLAREFNSLVANLPNFASNVTQSRRDGQSPNYLIRSNTSGVAITLLFLTYCRLPWIAVLNVDKNS